MNKIDDTLVIISLFWIMLMTVVLYISGKDDARSDFTTNCHAYFKSEPHGEVVEKCKLIMNGVQ